MNLRYVKHSRVSLKTHALLTEKWVQDRIIEDPAILGLGEVEVIDRERRQEKAGRLDLLLAGVADDRRYELELMLGSTDESHIVRCIEYWDIERRRYPAYDHVAVLVAEDITTRFLNLLGLFAGTIPMIVLQVTALQVEGMVLLEVTRVLDQVSLRRDDIAEGQPAPADRHSWIERVGGELLAVVDRLLEFVNRAAKSPFALNYNKRYIGMSDGFRARNFVYFVPKKTFVRMKVSFSDVGPWLVRCQEAQLEAWEPTDGGLAIRVSSRELDTHGALLAEILARAVAEYEE